MEGDVTCDIGPYGLDRPKTVFTISDDEFETDIRYFLKDHIGSGSFGVVCSAIDLETGEEVAIKKVAYAFDFTDDAADTLREMMILRQIQHPNIIALKSLMWPRLETEFEDVYMVLELMETTLHSYMRSRAEALPEDEIRRFMFEILCGVNYLHSANIMHRDLKPDNILLDSEGHLKICDFGLSISIDGSHNKVMPTYVGTRRYRAPELLVGNTNYGPSIDIWSVGCIFAEMLGGGVRIFSGYSTKNQLHRIITKLGKPGEEDIGFITEANVRSYVESHCSAGTSFETLFPKADAYALDLLEKMLMFNPMKRISAAEALQHPYMTPYWDPDAKTGPAVPARCVVELDVDDNMDEDEIRMKMLSEMQYYLKD